jgi:hypothetical protein
MKRYAFTALLLLTGLSVAGCEPRSGYHRGYGHGYGYDRDDDRDEAWEIVRRDPCRYEEYRRYADNHKNPEKRRRVVERLARDGCSLDRDRDHDRDRYYR